MKGRPNPEWLQECPELLPGEEIYVRAFWDLRTEATSGDRTLGRIPWSKAREYGQHLLGLEPAMLDPFWRVITACDTGFLEWMKSEHDRYVRNTKSVSGKKLGNRSTSRLTYGR